MNCMQLTLIFISAILDIWFVYFRHANMKYSRDFLLANSNPSPNKVTIDLSFLKHDHFKHLRPRKRGKRGGVRIRLRKRHLKPPLPTIVLGNAQSLCNKIDELYACCKHLHEYREANLLCLSETWFNESIADPHIDGFSVYRLDRSQSITGKSRGGGVCIFVNSRWCTNVTIKENYCSEDIELLCLALRPFYLPREFNQIFVTVAYIHPGANIKNAANKLYELTHKLLNQSPDSPCLIMGDFNKCKLKSTLPSFHQYVTCTTCGDKTLDVCYGNIRDAYKSRPLPNMGRSIHNMIQLVPT